MKTNHKVIIGDCLKELKKMEDCSVDLVFADPPYNISKKSGLGWKHSKHITMHESWDMFNKDDFFDFNVKWVTECLRVLKFGGSFWVSGSFHNIYQLGHIFQQFDGVKINNSIVWFKPNAQPNITCRFFTESTEHLIWTSKNGNGKKWYFDYGWTKNNIYDKINPQGKQTRNVWVIPLTPKSEKWAGEHPTQKPLELLRRVIFSTTKEGDLILDPFLGSGTTCVAAKMINRNSIGIEKDPKWLPIIKKRMETSQRTFHEEPDIEYLIPSS